MQLLLDISNIIVYRHTFNAQKNSHKKKYPEENITNIETKETCNAVMRGKQSKTNVKRRSTVVCMIYANQLCYGNSSRIVQFAARQDCGHSCIEPKPKTVTYRSFIDNRIAGPESSSSAALAPHPLASTTSQRIQLPYRQSWHQHRIWIQMQQW